jgi:hypothetical protein
MSLSESKPTRRAWVVVNYASVVTFIAAFIAGEQTGWTAWIVAVIGAGLLLAAGSFIGVYWKTGLWRLVHAKDDELDERQRQITHDALRHAYSIFTVVTLLILLYVAFTYQDWGIIVLASLIYFAHIIPASIIAWREKVV